MDNHFSLEKIDVKTMYQMALKHLARREYTRCSLQQKLLQQGCASPSLDVVLEDLIQKGFLNDVRFCEAWTERRIRQGYGPIRIAAELRQHGVAEALISTQLIQTDEFWLKQIKQIQQKKFKHSSGSRQEEVRQIRYLQYRGFHLDQIYQNLKNT